MSCWHKLEIFLTLFHCINKYFSVVQCNTVLCRTAQCKTVQCSAVQCSAVQCKTVQCYWEQLQQKWIVNEARGGGSSDGGGGLQLKVESAKICHNQLSTYYMRQLRVTTSGGKYHHHRCGYWCRFNSGGVLHSFQRGFIYCWTSSFLVGIASPSTYPSESLSGSSTEPAGLFVWRHFLWFSFKFCDECLSAFVKISTTWTWTQLWRSCTIVGRSQSDIA